MNREEFKAKMKRTIECSFLFDIAHRITGLDVEREKALHGHGLTLIVIIEADKLDEYNMIIDRNEIIKKLNPLIEKLDHSCILWKKDSLADDIIAISKKHGFETKIILINNNPTVEGLSDYLFKEVKERLQIKNKIKIVLKVSESLQVSRSE